MDCHRPGGAEEAQQFCREDPYKSGPGHSGRDTETQSSRTQGQPEGMSLGGESFGWTKRLPGVKGTDSGDTEPLPGCWGYSTSGWWSHCCVPGSLQAAFSPMAVRSLHCTVCKLGLNQAVCMKKVGRRIDGQDSGVHMDWAQDHQPPTTQSQHVLTSSGMYCC